jgi:hypothetical protein
MIDFYANNTFFGLIYILIACSVGIAIDIHILEVSQHFTNKNFSCESGTLSYLSLLNLI